ncbi:hypothetical protein LX16_0196 [Stackebrandtia albiflava]|uniref:Arthropod defensin n=1 Tax=Stackebrandtia albiflava TaxID=406432 RepID=A0A562V9F9_9ACTN|nr:hypothetical protein [Stackebrandtia albiflava]TWJ14511.1 hypothetical protein LX16_0196 [Stackebrandtia albiflava]
MGFTHRRDVEFEKTSGVAAHLGNESAAPMECCGCPDDGACREYCVANYGARGGYCEGFLNLRCRCIY